MRRNRFSVISNLQSLFFVCDRDDKPNRFIIGFVLVRGSRIDFSRVDKIGPSLAYAKQCQSPNRKTIVSGYVLSIHSPANGYKYTRPKDLFRLASVLTHVLRRLPCLQALLWRPADIDGRCLARERIQHVEENEEEAET